MIVWDAFLQYFVLTGERIKIITLVILALAFLIRRTDLFARVYERLTHVSVKTSLLIILGVAFFLRLAWMLWSPHTPPSAGTEDMIMLQHAHDLASGYGYRNPDGEFNADRPVGYPLLLAMFFKLFGDHLMPIEIVHLVFGVFTIFMVFYIGKQIGGNALGLFAAALLAVYPTSIFASKIILEEHIFIPLWLGGIASLISDFQSPRWSKVISAGLIFGLAAHFRPQSFAMGLVVFCCWIIFKRQVWQAISRALIIQLLVLVCALPWAVRNYHRFGEPIFYSTWIGTVMYFANNEIADVRYSINPTVEQGGDKDFAYAKNDLERNHAGRKAAVKWIKQNPSAFVQKALGRIIYMMGINREGWIVKDNFHNVRPGRTRPPDKFISKLDKMDNDYYGVILFLALLGFFALCFRTGRDIKSQSFWFIVFTIAYYFSILALTPGQRKYRFVIEPFLCLFASHALLLILKPRMESKMNKQKTVAMFSSEMAQ